MIPGNPDWARIITELKLGGYSQEDLAQLLGVSQPTVSRWAAKGKGEPTWSEGRKLLELHAGLTFTPCEQAPS